MITLYARREPTTDDVLLKHAPKTKRFDVVFYVDRQATQPKARFMWYAAESFRSTSKTVMLNCYRWRIEWLPKVLAVPVEAR